MPLLYLCFVRIPTLLAIWWRKCLWPQASHVPEKEHLSIIIFRLDALGDLVLTTPIFRALKTAHPGLRVTAVVPSKYKSLLVTNPHINEVLTVREISARWLPLHVRKLLEAVALYFTQLRNRQFNYAISPRWDVDEHLATFLCTLTNAARRVGYTCQTTPHKRLLDRGFDRAFDICLPAGPIQHELDRNLAVAQVLGAATCNRMPQIEITSHDRSSAARRVSGNASGKLVALGIGARSYGRRWPLCRYAEVANRIAANLGAQVLILCDATERKDALELNGMLRTPAQIISGTNLRELCALLERCDLFVGNDSGCAHLAAAMRCRTIVISRHPKKGDPNHFNSPVRFAPQGSTVRVLQPSIGKDGCTTACTVPEPHCITGVTSDQVLSAALQMLWEGRVYAAKPGLPPMTPASRRLLRTHSPDAVHRAYEILRNNGERNSTDRRPL